MNFASSVQYLDSLGHETLMMELGLEKTARILQELGCPHEKFLKIQIAGTNGKGSVSSFVESICRTAAIETGLCTSPNVLAITERIKVRGKEISERDFARHTTLVRDVCTGLIEENTIDKTPTFFEQITAIAVSAFAEAEIEVAVLETGLGGRLDSVTATDAEIIGITPIDYDHQEYLGESLTEIAAEKAAVIRFAEQKVVVSNQYPEAEKVIMARCEELGIAPKKTDFEYPNYELGLLGRHQVENAKVAIRLVEILREAGFLISRKHVIEGLRSIELKGRLEFFKGILFDGAHNVAGARTLRDYLDEFVKAPITMIFGAMADKDLKGIIEILIPKAQKIIFTQLDNLRSAKVDDLVRLVPSKFGSADVFQALSVEEAIAIARKISLAKGLICVTGSLYLVGEVQKILNGEDNPAC